RRSPRDCRATAGIVFNEHPKEMVRPVLRHAATWALTGIESKPVGHTGPRRLGTGLRGRTPDTLRDAVLIPRCGGSSSGSPAVERIEYWDAISLRARSLSVAQEIAESRSVRSRPRRVNRAPASVPAHDQPVAVMLYPMHPPGPEWRQGKG